MEGKDNSCSGYGTVYYTHITERRQDTEAASFHSPVRRIPAHGSSRPYIFPLFTATTITSGSIHRQPVAKIAMETELRLGGLYTLAGEQNCVRVRGIGIVANGGA
jgi:hypothetical protein